MQTSFFISFLDEIIKEKIIAYKVLISVKIYASFVKKFTDVTWTLFYTDLLSSKKKTMFSYLTPLIKKAQQLSLFFLACHMKIEQKTLSW